MWIWWYSVDDYDDDAKAAYQSNGSFFMIVG